MIQENLFCRQIPSMFSIFVPIVLEETVLNSETIQNSAFNYIMNLIKIILRLPQYIYFINQIEEASNVLLIETYSHALMKSTVNFI